MHESKPYNLMDEQTDVFVGNDNSRLMFANNSLNKCN